MDASGTVEKAVDLLFYLRSTSEAEGVTAIGRALGMPKSSTHRLLVALGRRQLVERDERGRYRLGAGLLTLGRGVLDGEPLVAAARPILEQEAGALGETFFLVGVRAGAIIVLDKVEGTGFLRAAPQVGARVPTHATAVGKLYLAFCADTLVRESDGLDAFTPHTLSDPAALGREVDVVRARGWAENRDEWIEGLSVVAAPVRAADRMIGSVALAAASARFEVLGLETLAQRVLAAGEQICARLEGRC